MLELDELLAATQSAQRPPEALRRALHSIAGSARTFGLADLSTAARAAEQFLDPCCEHGEPLPLAAQAGFESLLRAVKCAANPHPAA